MRRVGLIPKQERPDRLPVGILPIEEDQAAQTGYITPDAITTKPVKVVIKTKEAKK